MKVTIAPGDGIGPEIMEFVLDVFRAAEVPLDYESVDLGDGNVGLSEEARASIERTGVLLKGPVEGDGPGSEHGPSHPSIAARRAGNAYAEKRIYRMIPGVPTPIGHRDLGLTIVRGMIEEEYAPKEQMVDQAVAVSSRYATRTSCLRLHRYTFEMAARKGAKRVTCAHQAEVMKLVDGMFVETFYEVAKQYPDLAADDLSVDRLALNLLTEPEAYDVVVLTDMPGDLLPDLAAGIVGGLAYAPSASIGEDAAIFETVHGTARDAIGNDKANPSALLLAGTIMLRHLGLVDHAFRIESALERALYRMHKDPDVLAYVDRFHTSIFRHLMLGELRRELGEELPPWSGDPEIEPQEPAPKPRRLSGLPSIGIQLDGLA
ncbi:MAG: isocitrate/isopropylmalate family dehydrogenase [Planctomycetota bacterium]